MTVTRPLLAVLASLFILVVPVAHAETKVLTAEATYTMGDGETPSFAETMALQKAKQVALEQTGTYVESYTKVNNLDLTTEEIQTIAGGILEVEVLEKKRSLVGDGLQLYVKIKAAVTTDKMEELARRIKGKNVAEKYTKLQEDYARLMSEIEGWKKLVARASTGPEREAALRQIQEGERAFADIQEKESTLFRRLIAGETLIREAEEVHASVERIIQTIRDHGHVIKIGEVKAALAQEAQKARPEIETWDRINIALVETYKAGTWMKLSRPEKERFIISLLGKEFAPDLIAKFGPNEMQEFIKMCDHHADHFARLGPEEQQARVNKFIEDQRKFAEGLQRQFRVTVPVSLTLSDKVSAAVRGLAESLGGTLYFTPATGRIDYLSFRYVVPLAAIRKMSNENSPFAENRKPSYTLNPKDAWLDKHYLDQRLSGSFIGFSCHYETNSSFSQRLRRLALAVRLRFEDSGVLSCKVPYLVNRILPGVVVIFENLLHQRDQSVFVASFQDFGLGYDAYNDGDTRKAVSTTDFVALLPTPIHFEVSLIIPEEKTKRITGVEAKYEEVDSLENLKTEDVCLTRFRPS